MTCLGKKNDPSGSSQGEHGCDGGTDAELSGGLGTKKQTKNNKIVLGKKARKQQKNNKQLSKTINKYKNN